ncbi:hypothetical protein HK098_001510 [Nowakowskiella sp. JEL0407]|nr:hypothetical protein HK098_001510 [Nowakowskiella sp. JEL0407]
MYELLIPLLLSSIYLDGNEKTDYVQFKRRINSSPSFSNCLQQHTRFFYGRFHYKDDNEKIQLPNLPNLTNLSLNLEISKVQLSFPKNFLHPISAMNVLISGFDVLTTLRLDGILHEGTVIKGLARLFSRCNNVQMIHLNFLSLMNVNSNLNDEMNLSESYKLLSESLASVKQLQTFSVCDSFKFQENRHRLLSDVIVGLDSVPTLTELSVTIMYSNILPELIRYLTRSNISVLKLQSITVTAELADAIKRMPKLTHIELNSLTCSNTLLTAPLARKDGSSITSYKLNIVSFSEDLHSLDLISISNAVSFSFHHFRTDVDHKRMVLALYRSLINNVNLHEMNFSVNRVNDEEEFLLLIRLITQFDSLRFLAVNDYRSDWFSSHLDSFYDAVDTSGIRGLKLTPHMIDLI